MVIGVKNKRGNNNCDERWNQFVQWIRNNLFIKRVLGHTGKPIMLNQQKFFFNSTLEYGYYMDSKIFGWSKKKFLLIVSTNFTKYVNCWIQRNIWLFGLLNKRFVHLTEYFFKNYQKIFLNKQFFSECTKRLSSPLFENRLITKLAHDSFALSTLACARLWIPLRAYSYELSRTFDSSILFSSAVLL